MRVFLVCYSDMHFVNHSPDNQHFILEQIEKSVGNLRIFALEFQNYILLCVFILGKQCRPDHNGVARTLKKFAHQRETTGSSNDFLQLCPFSKWDLLLKERICS